MNEAINLGIEQFRSIRTEIDRRTSAQLSLIQLNVTGVGVIAGAFLSEIEIDIRVFFIIPVISPMLGLLWLDHAVAIRYLGKFIQDSLHPFLEHRVQNSVPNFETFVRELEKDLRSRTLLLGLPIFTFFGIIPFFALILPFVYGTLEEMREELLVFAMPGALALIIFSIFLFQYIFISVARTNMNSKNNAS